MFVVSDTNSADDDFTSFLDLVEDGDNIAFVYNMSTVAPTGSCEVSRILPTL